MNGRIGPQHIYGCRRYRMRLRTLHTSDRSSMPTYFREDKSADLYGIAHVVGWELHDLHDLHDLSHIQILHSTSRRPGGIQMICMIDRDLSHVRGKIYLVAKRKQSKSNAKTSCCAWWLMPGYRNAFRVPLPCLLLSQLWQSCGGIPGPYYPTKQTLHLSSGGGKERG